MSVSRSSGIDGSHPQRHATGGAVVADPLHHATYQIPDFSLPRLTLLAAQPLPQLLDHRVLDGTRRYGPGRTPHSSSLMSAAAHVIPVPPPMRGRVGVGHRTVTKVAEQEPME